MKRRLTAPRQVLEELREDYCICTKCKICQAVMVQECEDPRFWRNCPSGTRFRYDAYYASGKMEIARCLTLFEIEPDERMKHILYTCMLCGSCQEQCFPVKELHPLRVNELLRERAVLEGWGPLPEHQELLRNIEEHDNIYGLPRDKRADWAKGLNLKNALESQTETVLFAGCTYASDEKLHPRIRAVAEVMKAGGVDFGILGEEEICCGSPLLLLGDRDYFETLATANIEKMEKAGITSIITPCAHGYAVFKEEYTLARELEVRHVAEVAAHLITEGTLTPKKKVGIRAAYHDPCRLGRRLGVYDAPREVLEAIPGLELLEFPRTRNNALCCGGGGMVPFAFPEYSTWVASERLFEAESIGAEAIITACPFCVQTLEKAAAEKDKEIRIYDLMEVLKMSL